MSYNQSKSDRSESTQYRRTGGRSGSSNLQRNYSGGASTRGGGGGGASASSNSSNRGGRKYNGNAQGGQFTSGSPIVSTESGYSSAARTEQNGSQPQQPANRGYDAPATITTTNTGPTDAPAQKITRAVPKAPSSNVSGAATPSNLSTAGSESTAPATPAKSSGDTRAYPLQFGSISPGFMNGMQIPARTSSAPPNLDEQKKDQARHDSSRTAAPAMPIPSIPKQHLPKKDAGIHNHNQPTGETQSVSKPKRDPQVSGASPVTQSQKPMIHSPMQLPPYHQSQVPVHFPNPQIQSQPMSGASNPMAMPIPMPMPIPLHMGNSPVQQPMFIPGLSHAMMHGQNLNFSSPMGPQMPPQMGNMGMGMGGPPFPQQQQQQQGGKFTPSRKTVKITHPDTHEELRLDGSLGPPRSHPNAPPPQQSQPVTSFPPNHPMNYHHHNAYSPPTFFPASSTQVPSGSQPPRTYTQVTVKPAAAVSHAEKELVPPKSSPSIVKVESSKPSRVQEEDLVRQKKETELKPASVEEDVKGAVVPDSLKDKHEKSDEKDKKNQVGEQLTSLSSQLPEAEKAKEFSSISAVTSSEPPKVTSEDASKSLGPRDSESKVSKPEKSDNNRQGGAIVPEQHSSAKTISIESREHTCKIEESSDKEVISATDSVVEQEQKKPEASLDDVKLVDKAFEATEPTIEKSDLVDHESHTAAVSPPEGASKDESESEENGINKKASSDTNVAKTAPPKKIKRKDFLKKAEAAGTSSDIYTAYKGPEEKKETAASENTSADIKQQPQESSVSVEKPVETAVEPDDWEDAAEMSTPQLKTSKNETQGITEEDGNKKYSRDFLLKFAEQCLDLPEGFEITSDIADVLMSVSGVHISPHPSPGRNADRSNVGPRLDRRGSGLVDGGSGRGDMRIEVGYPINYRTGQGGNNFNVPRNHPRAQSPVQYVNVGGGILPMQSNLQRNNSDSDRWQRGTGFQKGLMPSPQTPLQVMHKAERKYEVGKVTDEEQAKQRQLKGILNKLTPQNFEKLFEQVKQVNIDNVVTLSGVISQIFDKALMEPTFCEMYANFCFHLAADLPDLSVEDEKITFKRLLLNKCQEEFERGEREEEEANKADEEGGDCKQTPEEREEKRLQVRKRMLGNIRLIGELYKKRMLTERIMHECINKLLGEQQNPDEENIEALCKLMSTIGVMIDHAKAKEHMDAYFDIMARLSNNMKLSSRVRFMLKDSIDLRKNKWQQRRKVEGPKKIDEVHRDAAQERQAQASRLARGPSFGGSARRGGAGAPPPMEYAPRAQNILSSPNFRPQLRNYGSQDVRIDSVPLQHRSFGDESITLGPQGGLGRGMSFRGHNNVGPSLNGFGLEQQMGYGQREDLAPRYIPERFVGPPSGYEQSRVQERNVGYENREVKINDRSVPDSPRGGRVEGQTGTQNVSSENMWSEEQLQEKSSSAIKEFYSARDQAEVVRCMKELNTPGFYPSMISIWVIDSFERKDMERDLLTSLIIKLTHDNAISDRQLAKGFELALEGLEEAVNDAPKAAEFLGRILAKVILEKIVALSEIGQLLYEGGEEKGRLVEIGLAAEVLASILDIIKSEQGGTVLDEIRSSSNLRLENFRPPNSKKASRLDKFI